MLGSKIVVAGLSALAEWIPNKEAVIKFLSKVSIERMNLGKITSLSSVKP